MGTVTQQSHCITSPPKPSSCARTTPRFSSILTGLTITSEMPTYWEGGVSRGGIKASHCCPCMFWTCWKYGNSITTLSQCITTPSMPYIMLEPLRDDRHHFSTNQIWGVHLCRTMVSWGESMSSHCYKGLISLAWGMETVSQHSHCITSPPKPSSCARTTPRLSSITGPTLPTTTSEMPTHGEGGVSWDGIKASHCCPCLFWTCWKYENSITTLSQHYNTFHAVHNARTTQIWLSSFQDQPNLRSPLM